MSDTAYYSKACSPCVPPGEEGEWVWIPKKTTAMPGFTASPHQSPTYHSPSAPSSHPGLGMPYVSFPPSPAYSPVPSDIPSVPEGSPVEPFLDGFDVDMSAFLDTYLEGMTSSWPFPAPENAAPTNLFTTSLGADAFSGLDYGLQSECGYTSPFNPPATISPTSSLYSNLGYPAGTSPVLGSLTPASLPTTNPSPSPTSPTGTTTAPHPQSSFPCPESSCAKSFPTKSELRKHERKHRHPARCPIPACGKGHLDNRALARHLWARHPEYAQQHGVRSERVQCSMCEYQGRADNVARHFKRHLNSAS